MAFVTGSRMVEVIVCTLDDAMEAQAGGADRLEVVRELASGGLTPEFGLVEQIIAAAQIPVRVMLRQNGSMQVKDERERQILLQQAQDLSRLKIDGLVTGFIQGGDVDWPMMRAIASAADGKKMTFHRAFDVLPDSMAVIRRLKAFGPVDRILTDGGSGDWSTRRMRLHEWQQCAEPEIRILAAAGLSLPIIQELQGDSLITEIHVGRAARIPAETHGQVRRERVAALKGLRG